MGVEGRESDSQITFCPPCHFRFHFHFPFPSSSLFPRSTQAQPGTLQEQYYPGNLITFEHFHLRRSKFGFERNNVTQSIMNIIHLHNVGFLYAVKEKVNAGGNPAVKHITFKYLRRA